MNPSSEKRNRITFGLGTIGRDMLYSLVSMYLIFYLTDILYIDSRTLWWLTGIILFARVFDALNDPIMGTIVDNTKSRFGKFKPWILIGAFISGLFTILLYTDMGLTSTSYIVIFAFVYIGWGISFTVNDIAYWSMLPSLTVNQKMREKIGAFARICANIGLFTVVAGIVPITTALGDFTGSLRQAWFLFAVVVVLIMWAGQSVTLFGVREARELFRKQETTTIKGMTKAIFHNDQLLYTAVSMALFMIGYVTTTSFGLYFFKYAYGDEGMYAVFAIILGVAQITALTVFPLFSKRFSRRRLYQGATVIVILGYVIFFFAPMNMLYIGAAGLLLFMGQAFIQLLMLVFLADTIEYGQWKLGRRNDSVSFSLQPFVNKMGGAVGSGITGITIIISGINDASDATDVTAEGLLIMKIAMLVLPLICITSGYFVYHYKYKIDQAFFNQIISDLKERGDLKS